MCVRNRFNGLLIHLAGLLWNKLCVLCSNIDCVKTTIIRAENECGRVYTWCLLLFKHMTIYVLWYFGKSIVHAYSLEFPHFQLETGLRKNLFSIFFFYQKLKFRHMSGWMCAARPHLQFLALLKCLSGKIDTSHQICTDEFFSFCVRSLVFSAFIWHFVGGFRVAKLSVFTIFDSICIWHALCHPSTWWKLLPLIDRNVICFLTAPLPSIQRSVLSNQMIQRHSLNMSILTFTTRRVLWLNWMQCRGKSQLSHSRTTWRGNNLYTRCNTSSMCSLCDRLQIAVYRIYFRETNGK